VELGVMIAIRKGMNVTQAFTDAREAGFSRGQVTSFIHGITAEQVRQIAVAARQAEFRVDAVGCYMNPLRMDDADVTGATLADWTTLVANMAMMNGVERIVCWSGTMSKMLGAPSLINGEEETFNNLFITLHGLLERVRGLPVRIILEPFTAHVLKDARTCVRMAQKFPGGEVKIVLDAANIVPPLEYAERDARVLEFVTEAAPTVGLIHIKDLGRDPSGHRAFLPAGQGTLAFGPYLRAISQYVPEVPVILEQLRTVDEMRIARSFIERTLKEYELPVA
jgi:sugar phosphate isomerase/epimerase